MASLRNVVGLNILVFSLIGLLHLSRILFQWTVVLGSWQVPYWPNMLGLALAIIFVYLNAKHLQKESRM